MNIKKLQLLAALASLAFVTAANAQIFTGSMGVVVDPFVTPTSAYTASSLTLNGLNLITTSETGTFAALVPAHSDLTAYTTTITGLSASPLADSIPNFFVFSTPDAFFATSGTTPNNRFGFNLVTIAETSAGVFSGTGTLVDTTAAYANTPATFTLSFSGAQNYSFTLAAVPEPTTTMIVGACLLLPFTLRLLRKNPRA